MNLDFPSVSIISKTLRLTPLIPTGSPMRMLAFIRRYRWSILIVSIAVAAWYPALDYLVDFRKPDVPYVETPPDVVEKMLDLAEVTAADTVYDLGSGDGRIPIAAGRRGAKALGIEIDEELVEKSRELVKAAGLEDRVRIKRGDIYKQDFTPASVVTMYLLPSVNAELRPQLDKLKPGTRIVSHKFKLGVSGAKPNKTILVHSNEDGVNHAVHLWITPLQWSTPAP